jgi:hypothetical protein
VKLGGLGSDVSVSVYDVVVVVVVVVVDDDEKEGSQQENRRHDAEAKRSIHLCDKNRPLPVNCKQEAGEVLSSFHIHDVTRACHASAAAAAAAGGGGGGGGGIVLHTFSKYPLFALTASIVDPKNAIFGCHF